MEIVECELFARDHRGLQSGGRRRGILAGVTRRHGMWPLWKPTLVFCRFDDGIATITAAGNHRHMLANDSVILDGMHQMVPL